MPHINFFFLSLDIFLSFCASFCFLRRWLSGLEHVVCGRVCVLVIIIRIPPRTHNHILERKRPFSVLLLTFIDAKSWILKWSCLLLFRQTYTSKGIVWLHTVACASVRFRRHRMLELERNANVSKGKRNDMTTLFWFWLQSPVLFASKLFEVSAVDEHT